MLFFNIYIFFVYCRVSSRPYKSAEIYRKTRHFGVVCGVWSIALCIKFGLGTFGQSQIIKSQDSQDFFSALLLAVLAIFTEILPLYAVFDTKFIQIFTCKHIETLQHTESAVVSAMLS